jgi:hypothetical protein
MSYEIVLWLRRKDGLSHSKIDSWTAAITLPGDASAFELREK